MTVNSVIIECSDAAKMIMTGGAVRLCRCRLQAITGTATHPNTASPIATTHHSRQTMTTAHLNPLSLSPGVIGPLSFTCLGKQDLVSEAAPVAEAAPAWVRYIPQEGIPVPSTGP